MEENKNSAIENTIPDEPNSKKSPAIEVVTGNGGLDISPVYDHLEIEKPKEKENKNILIPEVKIINKEKEAAAETEEEPSSPDDEELTSKDFAPKDLKKSKVIEIEETDDVE